MAGTCRSLSLGYRQFTFYHARETPQLFAYSRWRMGCTSVILITIALFSGGWLTVHSSAIPAMMLSGFIGIFIGDTALLLA